MPSQTLTSVRGGAPAVELVHLAKRFGAVQANADVSLKVAPGTIHAIVGENGAGKSTAMKMLYGVMKPDSGHILLAGKNVQFASPAAAIAAGIGMVHQHFMLAETHTVLDNIILGAEPCTAFWSRLPFLSLFHPIDRQAARAKLGALGQKYGLAVPLEARVSDLSVGLHQRIEILKLLYRNAQILVLDEPTAVLTPHEASDLFANLRALRDEGKSVLIITHKLQEVMSLADDVTVFRAGKVVGSVPVGQTSREELAELMVGHPVNLQASLERYPIQSNVALRIESLSFAPLKNLNLSVRKGEILGVAGVEGNGQSELLQIVAGPGMCNLKASGGGVVEILGAKATHLNTAQVRALGVGIIPEDRHRQALLLERSLRENFLLGLQRHPSLVHLGIIKRESVDRMFADACVRYDIRPGNPKALASSLSGGNQQKLVIAREMAFSPELLIAAQPTRGVDVGAIEFIHTELLRARNGGAGVLLISSDLEEILTLADRIVVLFEGRIVATFERGQCDLQSLGLAMGGAKQEQRA